MWPRGERVERDRGMATVLVTVLVNADSSELNTEAALAAA